MNACKSGGESPGPQGPVHWEARLCPLGNHAGAAAGRQDGGLGHHITPWLSVCLLLVAGRQGEARRSKDRTSGDKLGAGQGAGLGVGLCFEMGARLCAGPVFGSCA